MTCWFSIRRKIGAPKETTSQVYDDPIYDIPDINTASVDKTTIPKLKENVAYGEISH